MTHWGQTWSSDSDSDESATSYHSEDSSESGQTETAVILGQTFHLPQALCDNPEIFREVFSLETWNNFTDEQRQHLETLLPSFPEYDLEEKANTLGKLFNDETINFGNPLTTFSNQLRAGHFRPDVARMRSLLRKAQQKEWKRAQKLRTFDLLKSVLSSRQRLVDAVVNGEKPKPCPPSIKRRIRTSRSSQNVKTRYFQELALLKEEVGESTQSSEDEQYPEGPTHGSNKKVRRTTNVAELLDNDGIAPVLGTLSTTLKPWDPSGKPQNNPYATHELTYAQTLAKHIKRRTNHEDHPDLHTEGITLQDIAVRAKFQKRPSAKPIVQKKIKMKVARTQSISSPAIDEENDEGAMDFDMMQIKQEEEDEHKVDIEALEDLPHFQQLMPKAISSTSNSHSNVPKHLANSKIASLLMNKKIKLEPPDIPTKKLPLEPEIKKSRSDSTDSRKSKTDSVDSLIRKTKVERECPSPKRIKLEPTELPVSTGPIKVEQGTTTATLKNSVGSMTPISSLSPSVPALAYPLSSAHSSSIKPITPTTMMSMSSLPLNASAANSVCPTISSISTASTSSSTPVASVGSMTSISSLSPMLSSSLSSASAQTPPVFPSAASMLNTVAPKIMTPTPRIVPRMPRNVTLATLSDLDGYDMMDLPVDIDDTPHVEVEDIKPQPELRQDIHACFFSLIRDILLSTPDHRIEINELEKQVKAWASSPIGPLNPWYTPQLENQLSSAVLFLAGDPADSLPDDFVPYMEWKLAVGAYQWIGAGRDSDHRLTLLCNLWLERGAERPIATTVTTTSVTTVTSTVSTSTTASQAIMMPDLPPRGPAVRPTSPRKKELFRQQEKERYDTPHKAFLYSYGGNDCSVGPVRSMQAGSNASKARGHALLVEDRPKHITIFELVRDAVARCPNSQGTRADIVTLLKDSQYLIENAPEPVLSSAVSSALDRLHYEHDPIVKYDTKRKIWMYLHKGRSLEEHERLHAEGADMKTSRPKNSKRSAKPKKEPAHKSISCETVNELSALPEVPIVPTFTDSSTSTGTNTLPVTSGNVPLVSSPLLIQAKPKTTLKTTTIGLATKKVMAEAVKNKLGKAKLRLQDGQNLAAAVIAQQQLARLQAQSFPQKMSVATSPKKSVEVPNASSPSSVSSPASLPVAISRPIVQEIAATVGTSLAKSQTPTMLTKKAGSQTVSVSPAEIINKPSATKNIVKILTSQGTTQSVRTVQRLNQQVSQQQILQLKQQLMAESSNVLQKAQLKKAATSGHQQLLVRMQSSDQGTPGQGQVIVINQQQIIVDSPQLAQQLKQQPKQLQQLLSKQVQQVDQPIQQTSSQTTSSVNATSSVQKVTTQQQLNQIILNKQQQILIGDQSKAVKGQSQMILMKQPGSASSSSDGTKPQVQQMILAVKPGVDGEGTAITSQQLHQMIVLNKQQNPQQIYMVKPDQKSLQVITQQPLKAQAQQVTLAQLQQLQQQQQRSTGTSTILNTSRVVAQVSSAPVNTVSGTALLKPQVVTGASGTSMVAKVVTSSQTPVLTMENILAQHKQQTITQQAGGRMPAVSRPLTSQYVVSLPQTRVVQSTMQQVVATTSATGIMAVAPVGGAETTKIGSTTQGVRIPGLNLANIAGKQVLLASKPPTVQGQNVLLGNSSGQALLVGGNQQGTVTVLQQGSQQILLPPGVVKTIQGLKVIPLAQGKPNQAQAGRHQMIARISGMRPVIATNIVQESVASSSQHSSSQQSSSSSQSNE